LRTLLVTAPWRSAGDRGRRNSAAASRGLRIYVDDRIMPTVAWCASFGLPAARARLCRAVGTTGTSRRLADSSPKVLVGGGCLVGRQHPGCFLGAVPVGV